MRSVALLLLVAIGSLCRAQQTGEQLLMNAASAYREGRVDEAFSLANEAIEVAPAGRFLALGEHGHLLWLDLNPDGYRILSRA